MIIITSTVPSILHPDNGVDEVGAAFLMHSMALAKGGRWETDIDELQRIMRVGRTRYQRIIRQLTKNGTITKKMIRSPDGLLSHCEIRIQSRKVA